MASAPSVRKQQRAQRRAEEKAARAQQRGARRAPIVWIGGALIAVLAVVAVAMALRAWFADPLERGRAAMAAGNFRSARVDLMNAASAHPRDASVRIDLARTYVALQRGDEAQRQLARAQELGADAARLRVVTAEAALIRGDAAAALAAVDGPVPASDAANALRIAAQAQYRLGNAAQAQMLFDRALSAHAGDADLWVAYARFRLAEQDLVDADRAADRARDAAPTSAAALFVKADVVRARGGPVASLGWYAAGLEQDPDNVPMMLEQAAALGESGRYVAMLDPLLRAAELEPGNPRALFLQAAIAARSDEAALARTLLNRIGGGDADVPAVLQLRAAVELALDTPVAASRYAARLLELQPDNRTARRLLALAQAGEGNPRGVIMTIDPITTQADADSWSLLLLSRSFAAIGWIADAAQPLDRAATLARGTDAALSAPVAGGEAIDPRVAVPLIRARIDAGAFDAAAALADRLAEGNPGVAQAWLLRGDVEAARGSVGAALPYFQRAAEIRFDQPVMLRLVDALARTGNRDGARLTLNQFMARWPENVAAMRVAGSMAAEEGDWTRAHAALVAAAARIGANDALLVAQLARCELELGRVSAALPLARRAYRLLPGNGTVSGIYGLALARSGGSRTDARDLLDKAVQLSPDDPLLRQWRAEVWE